MEAKNNVLDRDEGLLSRWVRVGATLAERSIEHGFGLARDIHGEIGTYLTSTIDWMEGSQRTLFAVVRHVQSRTSKIVGAVLDAGEQSSHATVIAAQATSHGATRLVSH